MLARSGQVRSIVLERCMAFIFYVPLPAAQFLFVHFRSVLNFKRHAVLHFAFSS
jgi:hypothetical protein